MSAMFSFLRVLRGLFRPVVLGGALLGMLVLGGCQRSTPEERLDRVNEALKQRDVMTAELEAQKIVEKHSDDPASTDARMILATIYERDGRLEDAVMQYDSLLEQMPLSGADDRGIRVLARRNAILKQQKRFDEIEKSIDEMEKKYAQDENVQLNLLIGRADLRISQGQTSEARTMLAKAREETTVPGALIQFREMEIASYRQENNTTGAMEFLQQEFESSTEEILKRDALTRLLAFNAELGNYEETRRLLEEATKLVDAALEKEIDPTLQRQEGWWLANLHQNVASYPSAREILIRHFDAVPDTDLPFVQSAVPIIFESFLRQGQVDQAFAFGEKAARRFPPFEANLNQLREMRQQGQFENMENTAPLALKFGAEEPILPKSLPAAGDGGTTATARAAGDGATTGTAGAGGDRATTGAAAAGAGGGAGGSGRIGASGGTSLLDYATTGAGEATPEAGGRPDEGTTVTASSDGGTT